MCSIVPNSRNTRPVFRLPWYFWLRVILRAVSFGINAALEAPVWTKPIAGYMADASYVTCTYSYNHPEVDRIWRWGIQGPYWSSSKIIVYLLQDGCTYLSSLAALKSTLQAHGREPPTSTIAEPRSRAQTQGLRSFQAPPPGRLFRHGGGLL